MLVALAVTLVMMAAVVNLFANISGSIRNRRAMIEVGGQIRQVRQRLALDLEGATCAAKTWQLPSENCGYIEIIEGEYSDAFPSILVDGVLPATASNPELDYATSLVPSGGDVTTDLTLTNPQLTARQPQLGDVTNGRALGDWDDTLALTVRSESEPFRGRVSFLNAANVWEARIEGVPLAEVIWFCGENRATADGELGMRKIYRRALLIAPSAALPPLSSFSGTSDDERLLDYYSQYDVSARVEGGQLVPNTLGDLTKREFRFSRAIGSSFPHLLSRGLLSSNAVAANLLLSDALAFDVRVFDAGAPLYNAGVGAVVQPGDPGWVPAATAAVPPVPVGFGAYCDMGWNLNGATRYYTPSAGALAVPFSEPHQAGYHPRYNAFGGVTVFDTWSFHYENDGINQDIGQTDLVVTNPGAWRDTLDQGTNGLDDDNINGVDDMGERETSPPYDTPLRGVKVILRIYETDARQIRETSVTHSFAP
ncbi:MAG: hypothetical protein H0T51_01060 [Pirellulales bacterium]|nr:hypothetical protein [Pirellulales bacterium]